MTEASTPQPTKPRRRLLRRLGVGVASVTLMLVLILGGALVLLSGSTLSAPDWATKRLEASINKSIAPARVGLSGIELAFESGEAPLVSLEGIRVFNGDDRFLAWVPRARLSFDRASLIAGKAKLNSVLVEGLRMSLRRGVDGNFDFALGRKEGAAEFDGTPAQLADRLNALFSAPGLEALDLIEASNVRLVITDQMASRVWDISSGELSLSRQEAGAEMRLSFSTPGFADALAKVEFNLFAEADGPAATFGVRMTDFATNDIADWGQSLSWLSLLWAPASGAMRVDIDDQGAISNVNASLDLGQGLVRIPGTERAVNLNGGRTYFRFDPAAAQVVFDEMLIDTAAVRIVGDGHILLRDGVLGPELVTQLQFYEVAISPDVEGDPEPIVFTSGGADLRLVLDPFRVDVGQIALTSGETRFVMKGRAEAAVEEFRAGLDVTMDRISTEAFLALWPENALPKARIWLAKHLLGGVIHDASASIRLMGQEPPIIGAEFTFDDVVMTYLPKQPPLIGLDGYGAVEGRRMTIVADRAEIQVDDVGLIDASGTVFIIEDLVAQPSIATINVRASGPLQAQLALLDKPPFRFLTRAGRSPDVATGYARTDALVQFPLLKIVPDDQISYDVSAVATNVRSETLIDGYVVDADRLAVTADRRDGLRIAGRARLNGVPVEGEWIMPLADPSDGSSRLTGAVEISQAGADALAIGLPPGTINGTGLGRVEVDFPNDAAPRLRFFSDMNRIGLSVPQVGWSKRSDQTGTLEVLAEFTSPPKITAMSMTAPGLAASGSIDLSEDGTLDVATLDSLDIKNWFFGAVILAGRGPHAPFDVAVTSGRLDIRRSKFASQSAETSGALDVQLDRLVIGDTIALTGLRSAIAPGRGLQGNFTGRINGNTAVTGSLLPSRNGTAVNVRSDDGGGVLRDAGLLSNGFGGDLRMSLVPREREGYYDGTLEIADLRVRDAPALAELLSAISVVGLLDQLDRGELVFNEVAAEFVLTPDSVIVKNSRAVGAAMGLTMDGSYDLETGLMDMQGVVTPIYLVNGIGQLVSRRGEGLFGITYRMKGEAANPKVSVNPLSILTPGFLRDIFRKKTKNAGE